MTRDMARTGTTTLTIKTDSRLIEDHLVISSGGNEARVPRTSQQLRMERGVRPAPSRHERTPP